MCGIAGWIGWEPDRLERARRAARALRHRGPDGQGIEAWAEAALVHTRLSVIDLSPAGAQPMANEEGTVWTVFNGEIYNHRELRDSLQARGHRFKGRSDSEVLPHLYEEFGPAFVEKLRGMFAFAVYDARRRKLLLARDRFGIKPLFYAPSKARLAFASEIRTLKTLPGIDLRVNRQAMCDFAALLYIPAPQTVFTGIRALEPGEMLEAELNGEGVRWRTRKYHRWVIAPDPDLSLDRALRETERLLAQAVSRQLESDVPLGALLSGGIDSSLVSAAAQRSLDGALQTFNVRFPDPVYDETWAAVAVADHIGSRHRTLDMEGVPGTWDAVTDLLVHAGQPFADTSLFAVHAISRLMRRHVTVALSGDGGDEAFGGYRLHWQLGKIAQMQKLPRELRSEGLAVLLAVAPSGPIHARVRRLKELSDADDAAVLQALWSWLRPEEHAELCRDATLLPVRRWFEPTWEYRLPPRAGRAEHLSARATEIITRMTLANDFLFKVDIASMKEGLEIRVPFLDEDLFAFGLTLPHRLRVQRGEGKRILRLVAARQLPPSVARKRKGGFAVPVDRWVDAEFRARLREALLGTTSHLPDYFRCRAYRRIVEAFCDGRPLEGVSRAGLYQRAIMLLAAHVAISPN